MRILLLSAYHAASHQQWADELMSHFPEHEWTLLALPPRYFSWRIRGNSLTWAFSEQENLSKPYNLLVATSMVDLSALRGMVPALANIPTLLYFHENQFTYPISHHKKISDKQSSVKNSLVEPQLVTLYSALCADKIAFNTKYNRDSFISGVSQLLYKLPDGIPKGIIPLLSNKSSILPVPISDHLFLGIRSKENPEEKVDFINKEKITLVWNHRWEYDKGPDKLLAALKKLPLHLPLTFHIIGQSFRQQPRELQEIQELLIENHWLGKWGYIESKDDYLNILKQSDIVLSTALHDFQGLSVLESVAAGCIPIVPDRLSYQELFSEHSRYISDLNDSDREATALADKIISITDRLLNEEKRTGNQEDIDYLSWSSLHKDYQELFHSMTSF